MPVNADKTRELAELSKSFISASDARDRLGSALREHLSVQPRDCFWMCDDGVTEEGPVAIYNFERASSDDDGTGVKRIGIGPGEYFRIAYKLEAGKYTFGDPVKVRRVTDYQPVAEPGVQKSLADRIAPQYLVPDAEADLAKSGGPFIGPHGGKWADAKHTIPWKANLGEELHARLTEYDAKETVAMYGRKGINAIATPPDDGNARGWKVHEVEAQASVAKDGGTSKPAKLEPGMNAAQPAAAAKHMEEASRHDALAAHWGRHADTMTNRDDEISALNARNMHRRAATSHRRAADLLSRVAPAGHHLEMHSGANSDGASADEESAFQGKLLRVSPAPTADVKKSITLKPRRLGAALTEPERELAKALGASHRAAAEAQPDAGAKAAHLEAAELYEGAARTLDTPAYRAEMGRAGALGGLVKSWCGMPDNQRRSFAEFRKSMQNPVAAKPFAQVQTGNAALGLASFVEGSRPAAEPTVPHAAPEASRYSPGALNRAALSKSTSVFYERLYHGARPAVLNERFPAEAPLAKSGGPFIGPHGGKWADSAHTIPWKESAEAATRSGLPEDKVVGHRVRAMNNPFVASAESHREAAKKHQEKAKELRKLGWGTPNYDPNGPAGAAVGKHIRAAQEHNSTADLYDRKVPDTSSELAYAATQEADDAESFAREHHKNIDEAK